MKVKGYILAIITAISFGLIPLFMIPLKATMIALDTILFYRFLIAALALLLYLIYTKESLKTTKKELGILGSLGVFYALSSEFLFLGYDYTTPGIASTILFTYPVIVVMILAVFFKEKITKPIAFSLMITLCGVFSLSIKDTSFTINFFGLFVCLLGALTYAVYIIIINKSSIKASGIKITFYSLLFSSAFYFVKAVILGKSLVIPSSKILLDISIFSLVTTVLSVTTLVYAIKYIGSTPTSIMGALEPVVAIFISVGFFQEKLTFALILGVILILIGVSISIISDRVKNSKVKKLKPS